MASKAKAALLGGFLKTPKNTFVGEESKDFDDNSLDINKKSLLKEKKSSENTLKKVDNPIDMNNSSYIEGISDIENITETDNTLKIEEVEDLNVSKIDDADDIIEIEDTLNIEEIEEIEDIDVTEEIEEIEEEIENISDSNNFENMDIEVEDFSSYDMKEENDTSNLSPKEENITNNDIQKNVVKNDLLLEKETKTPKKRGRKKSSEISKNSTTENNFKGEKDSNFNKESNTEKKVEKVPKGNINLNCDGFINLIANNLINEARKSNISVNNLTEEELQPIWDYIKNKINE